MNKETAFFGPLIVTHSPTGEFIILDGQHRWEALRSLYEDPGTSEELAKVKEAIDLYEIPMLNVSTIYPQDQRQIFHDMNYYAKKVSRSLAIDYNYRDFIAKILHEILSNNETLNNSTLRGKGRKNKTQVFQLSVWSDVLMELTHGSTSKKALPITPKGGITLEQTCITFMDLITESVIALDDKSAFTNKPAVLRGIARFTSTQIAENRNWLKVLTTTLKKANLNNLSDEILESVNFYRNQKGQIQFSGTEAGIRGIVRILQQSRE